MQYLRFDFPAIATGVAPLHFSRPRLRLVAHHPGAVAAVLAHADALARAGEWVAGVVTYEAGAAFDPAFRFRPRSSLSLAWFGVFDAPATVDEEAPRGPVRCDDWQPGVERERYERGNARQGPHPAVCGLKRLATRGRAGFRFGLNAARACRVEDIAEPATRHIKAAMTPDASVPGWPMDAVAAGLRQTGRDRGPSGSVEVLYGASRRMVRNALLHF